MFSEEECLIKLINSFVFNSELKYCNKIERGFWPLSCDSYFIFPDSPLYYSIIGECIDLVKHFALPHSRLYIHACTNKEILKYLIELERTKGPINWKNIFRDCKYPHIRGFIVSLMTDREIQSLNWEIIFSFR